MDSALYGPAHPYGFTEIGTEPSNKAMSRDDLQKFWSQNFVPNNAALIVSGQVDGRRAQAARRKGVWRLGERHADAGDARRRPGRQRRSSCSSTSPARRRRSCASPRSASPRNTPDYEPIVVMNEILGGLFSSRINLNLREEHGYTYGASSQFVFRRAPGPFLVGTGVRTDVTGPAVAEIMKELKRIRESDVSQDELTLSKDSLVRSLPADFETSGSMNATTANTFIYDLGLRLLREAGATFVGGDHRSGPRCGPEVRRAGEARGGRRGRSGEGRSGTREAESRGDRVVERRRDARLAAEVYVRSLTISRDGLKAVPYNCVGRARPFRACQHVQKSKLQHGRTRSASTKALTAEDTEEHGVPGASARRGGL